jgi:hypothetical protein
VDIDGSIFFNKGFSPRNVVSAPGTIEEGVKYIVSARLDNTTGMILRVNGVQVGSAVDADARADIVDWADPRLGQLRDITLPGGEYGIDKLLVWIGMYSVAASDTEIEEMESFLTGVFGDDFRTQWEPFPNTFISGQPKPLTILAPVVEFDVRQVRDDPQYNDGDSLVVVSGGVGWKDLITTDQQGRTDANFNTSGNVVFVKEGWTPGIDAVRFVGFPFGAPTNPLGSRLPWIGGGIGGSDIVGNNYFVIGVMRATDISQRATLMGSTAGLSPIFPKKTVIWVEPDGSVVCHHTAEELVATIQPGSFYSIQSAPGVVQPGDDLIISLTSSAIFGDRQGKILRVNGVEVARNSNAFATFTQEFIAPTIGAGGTQAQAVGSVDSVGGLDRLIVYLALFGSLPTEAEVRAYESYLADAFQLDFRTQWTNIP